MPGPCCEPSSSRCAASASGAAASRSRARAPGGGHATAPWGLTLGRHAFHARALEHCLDGAGIPTVAGRPRTGDENAPDLELVLNHPQAGAFVALYADPSRAREYAPAIRRRIERGGGVL